MKAFAKDLGKSVDRLLAVGDKAPQPSPKPDPFAALAIRKKWESKVGVPVGVWVWVIEAQPYRVFSLTAVWSRPSVSSKQRGSTQEQSRWNGPRQYSLAQRSLRYPVLPRAAIAAG